MRSLHENLKFTKLQDPLIRTADANTSSVDMLGYGSLALGALIGITGDTLSGSVKVEVEVEESDDNTTFTDVANADLTNYVTGTNVGTVAVIDDNAEDDVLVTTGYKGSKRYVRMVMNFTGTHTNGIETAAFAVQGHPELSPTVDPT